MAAASLRSHLKVYLFAAAFFLALHPLGVTAQSASGTSEQFQLARAQSAQEAGDYKAAENIYHHLLARDPTLVQALFGLGATYYQDHQYADSVAYLLKVLSRKPGLFPAQLIAGIDYLKLGKPDRAVPYLRRAQRLRPTDEYANHNLANAEYLAGDYRSACADYLRFLQTPGQGDNAASWYGLGEVLLVLAREAATRVVGLPRSDPYRLWFLAKLYQEQQAWNLAITKFKLLATHPTWRERANLEMGELYLGQGRLTEATREFQEASSANPASARAAFGLGLSLLLQKNVNAIPHFLVVSEKDPWLLANPEHWAKQAQSLHLTFNPAWPRKSGSPIVDGFISSVVHPGNAQPAFANALRAACERRHQQSEAKWQVAVHSAATPKVLLNLAETFLNENDAAAAVALLNHLATVPADERNFREVLYARAAAAQSDAIGAATALQAVLDDKSPRSSFWAAVLAQQISQLSLGHVLSAAPTSAYTYLLRAQIQQAQNHTEAAVRDYQLAVQATPEDSSIRFKLGDLLWQKGHFQEAIAVLRDGLKLDPENAAAYYELGDSYLNLADPDSAQMLLFEAVRHDPELDAAYKDLGEIYLNQGKFQQSIRVLEKAAPRDTDGSEHYLLYRAYLRLGEKAQAAAALSRFQELKAEHEKKQLLKAEEAGGEAPPNLSTTPSIGATPQGQEKP